MANHFTIKPPFCGWSEVADLLVRVSLTFYSEKTCGTDWLQWHEKGMFLCYPSTGGCSKWQHSDRRQEYQIANGSNASFSERNDISISSLFSRHFLLSCFLFFMLWTTCVVWFKNHRCEKVIWENHGVSCLPYCIDSVEKSRDSHYTRAHSGLLVAPAFKDRITLVFIFVCLFIWFLFHLFFFLLQQNRTLKNRNIQCRTWDNWNTFFFCDS